VGGGVGGQSGNTYEYTERDQQRVMSQSVIKEYENALINEKGYSIGSLQLERNQRPDPTNYLRWLKMTYDSWNYPRQPVPLQDPIQTEIYALEIVLQGLGVLLESLQNIKIIYPNRIDYLTYLKSLLIYMEQQTQPQPQLQPPQRPLPSIPQQQLPTPQPQPATSGDIMKTIRDLLVRDQNIPIELPDQEQHELENAVVIAFSTLDDAEEMTKWNGQRARFMQTSRYITKNHIVFDTFTKTCEYYHIPSSKRILLPLFHFIHIPCYLVIDPSAWDLNMIIYLLQEELEKSKYTNPNMIDSMADFMLYVIRQQIHEGLVLLNSCKNPDWTYQQPTPAQVAQFKQDFDIPAG
jgi:hypothetical protein